jgi:hypothetical protein
MIEIFQSVTGVLMVGETEGHTDKVFYEIKTPRVIQIQQVGNGMVKVNFAPLLGNPKAVFIVLDKIVFNYEPDAELIQKYREAVSGLTLATNMPPMPPPNVVPFKKQDYPPQKEGKKISGNQTEIQIIGQTVIAGRIQTA